jgi:hypothetical protein
MAKGFSFEEALQPTVKGFSFEDALPPEPTLSPEEQMMSSSVGQVAPQDPNAPSLLAKTTLPANAPPSTGRSFEESIAGPDISAVPKFDASKMPTAEDRAVAQFGITPEMGIGEKALRTGKASLYGAATGLEQTWLGGARMISDITGLGKEGVTGVSKQLSKEQQAVEKTFAPEYGLKIAKDIGSSVVQTLPVMGVGLATNTAGALTTMFTQSFMQTYDDSRNEGLGVGASTARSALFGTAEAVGESLGLGSLLKSAKAALKGVPTAELAKDLAAYMIKEIPGEQLTYVSQFLTDKGFGLNPEAGLKEFLQGAQDTALVTVGQTAVMGSAGFATNKVLKDLRSYHSKGEEGIPKAADMMKAAGFSFEQAQPKVAPVEPTPVISQAQPPEAAAPVAQPVTPPATPTPIGQGEFEAPESLTPVRPPVEEEITPTKKTLFEKKPNDPAIEAEALKLADQIAQAGNNLISDAFKNRIEKTGGFTNDNQLDFYRQKLLETQQKAGTAGEKVQETFNIENYLPTSNKAELKRFKEFLPNAPEDVKTTIEKSNQYLQNLTNKINELGYKVLDVDPRAPAEVRELKSKISGIAGSTFRYAKDAEHIARNNRFANPEKMAKTAQTLEQDFAEADQLLGVESVKPKIEEIVSPQVAASMKDIEFQNKLIKANKEQTITKTQFSRLFKLYQDGKTPQANEQLTKMLAQNEKKAKKEEPEEEHIEGKKAEPVTTATIEKAITKVGETVDYAKMKKAAENQVDQAIKRTEYQTQKAYNDAKIPENKRFVTIKLEGDGSFKVMNNKERLEDFKKKLGNAIKPKQAGTPRREWQSAAVGFKAESAFKNFLDEKEPDTAVAIANLTGLDITKVALTPAQKKTLEKFIQEKKETGGEEPMMETIKSKPGANVARIAKLLGPQLYGSMSDITNVSVKEMIQNSFDAIKTMIEKKETDFGKIDIVVDKDQRTVAMTDDGSGMSPETLANVFLTIAGTKKDTEFGSGGFGIAKMLFLFGNKEVEVMTMKDGKISSMYAQGGQLMAALEDPSQAPDITVMTKEEMPDWDNMFPKGHGTFVRVTVPEEFKDQSTGDMKKIDFPTNQYSFNVLELSPLFHNIKVTFNGNTVYGMGSDFYANEYTTFVDAKFDWGTARIYVSNDQRDSYGKNMHILSNGLWQFSEELKLDPMDLWGKNIPHRFYLDIVSKVKPDEEGYPFQLNRQGFTKEAEKDLRLIKNYLVLHYRQKDYNSTVQNFGTVQYLSKSGKDIIKSKQESLVPESEKVEQKEGIKEGSKVEVKDGKLIVNGKEVPLLTPEDLKKASIDIDSLRVPQEKIDSNKVMIHDNLEVSNDTVKSQLKENELLLEENWTKRHAISDLLSDAETEQEIETLKDQQLELRKEQNRLIERQQELGKLSKEATFTPITTLARDKFGDRFDKFMFDIGDAFMALRDAVSSTMPVDKRGVDYKDLANEAIGISFDKEYRGVSITLPFKGLFLNPAFPEYIDTPEEAALGMFGTMIHELAHHKVRNHGADFPAEMQRILIKLEASSSFDIQQLKKDFILTVKENKDIIDFLNREGSNESNRPIGQRFKDSQQQARGEGTPEDVSKRGAEQRGESRVSGEPGQRTTAAGEKQQLESVSSKDKAAKVKELLQKHNRPNTPLHPSGEVKDTIMGGYQKSKKIATKMAENPLMAVNNMTGKLDRAVTYARNKNVWYGSGLDQADFAKYNGQLRNSQGLAVASIAVTNAIHAGHIATQVMIQGKLEFNPKTQMFRAVKDKKSLANVVRLKHELAEKLGARDAADLVNSYFEAKRSRSIVNEYLNRSADYEAALEAGEDPDEAAKNLQSIEIAIQKVNMDDEAIDDFISMEKDYPELRQMMDNWTAVNKNMLDMMEFAGNISKKRAEHLRNIKDYVPWYRIMDDQTDVHMPAGVRGMTNAGQEKKFKAGATERDIDDIVDNMIHNVMMMTRNSMKNYANNRIAMEYATRNEKGKIRLYPSEKSDENGVRVNLLANGRRVIVNIPDPLVAEASLGMENIEIPMIEILAFFAQGLRRGITTNPAFQLSQMFMDSATAGWVSGVKNPAAVWAGTFGSFIRALKPHDPIVDMLKSYGYGGYQSSARTPEKEMKLEIGLLNKSVWAKAMKTLDHIGDASDYAQRRAIYKQVLAETGDEMQALMAANNVIDFLKRGSGKGAQFVTRTVSFMNAYAQSIDVLAQALAGGGLKGKTRKQAQIQMLKTGMLLAGTTLLYCMAVGADDEYDKLDDQTKIRNIIIPGTQIRLPMHTSASFFFKAIPELIYNKVMKEGTKNQVDWTRLKKALGEAAIDSLLGPNMIPTGVKPVAEIALNHNFFTGNTVTPKGMEKLESFRQYTSATSELGKVLSGLTMGALNPIEADHLVRGLFGTAGAAVMYGSNLFSGDRVAPQAKDNPLYGSFILPDVPRGREDLFYDLKERSDKKYETFVDLMKKQHKQEAQEFRVDNKGLIAAHGFVTGADAELKRINAEIRRLSDLPADKMSSEEKRARITRFQEQKNRILEKTIDFRLKAGL